MGLRSGVVSNSRLSRQGHSPSGRTRWLASIQWLPYAPAATRPAKTIQSVTNVLPFQRNGLRVILATARFRRALFQIRHSASSLLAFRIFEIEQQATGEQLVSAPQPLYKEQLERVLALG